jgi:hypothetical protein
MIFTLALWAKLTLTAVEHRQTPLTPVLGFIFAQFVVDFASGILHWACDTWGQF